MSQIGEHGYRAADKSPDASEIDKSESQVEPDAAELKVNPDAMDEIVNTVKYMIRRQSTAWEIDPAEIIQIVICAIVVK